MRIPPKREEGGGELGSDGVVGDIGGHRRWHSPVPHGGGRAFHLACNPVDTHYLAVACGDRIARVFDRRWEGVGEVGGRGGRGRGRVARGVGVFVISSCPGAAGADESATFVKRESVLDVSRERRVPCGWRTRKRAK